MPTEGIRAHRPAGDGETVGGPVHAVAMTSWSDVERAEPGCAARVRRIFEAHKHKTIATLRADGSPRISGIEAEFGVELTFGSMPGARKGADLHRDPRFALHSATVDPPEVDPAGWPGDAKISGLARYARELDGDPPGELFTADIGEVVITALDPTATVLVIESWRPGRGLRRVARARDRWLCCARRYRGVTRSTRCAARRYERGETCAEGSFDERVTGVAGTDRRTERPGHGSGATNRGVGARALTLSNGALRSWAATGWREVWCAIRKRGGDGLRGCRADPRRNRRRR